MLEIWIGHHVRGTKRGLHLKEELLPDADNTYHIHEYAGTLFVKTSGKEDISRVFINYYNRLDSEDRIEMQWNDAAFCWYDPGTSRRYPIGINQCGTFFIEGEDIHQKLVIRSMDIVVSSQLMTKDEYIKMQDELRDKLEDLSSPENRSLSALEKEHARLRELKRVKKQLKELGSYVETIDENPHEELIQERVKRNVTGIRGMNQRLMIERRLYPYKPAYTVDEFSASSKIQEHRMIRWAVDWLIADYKRMAVHVEERIVKVKDEDDALIQSLKEGFLRQTRFEKDRILQDITSRRTYLNETRTVLQAIRVELTAILETLADCLSASILDTSGEELSLTHLFQFSPLYSKVFHLFQGIMKVDDSRDVATTYRNLQKSYHLYEVWGLLTIIHLLIHECGFSPLEDVYGRIRKHSMNHNPLNGLVLTFERPMYMSEESADVRDSEHVKEQAESGKVTLTLKYDVVITGTVKGYRPDYTFIFHDQKKGIDYTAYLDAKYQPSENVKRLIQSVSYERYYRTVKPLPVASFLMHPQAPPERENPWNRPVIEREANRHRFGSLEVRPGQTDSLRKWFMMITHYHLGYERVCFSCGTHQLARSEINSGSSWRRYHTCQNNSCQAFWVVTRCFNRRGGSSGMKDAHSHQSGKLVKYPNHTANNYHVETINEWDVKCPVCDKCMKDYRAFK